MPRTRPRLAINEAAYRDLVDGRTVTLTMTNGIDVDVTLDDIGWERLLQALDDAQSIPVINYGRSWPSPWRDDS